jgi:class 3 adenylate cyclase
MASFESAFRERFHQGIELAAATVKAREAADLDHPDFTDLEYGEARSGEGVVMFLDIRSYTRLAMAFASRPEETAKIIDAVVGGAVEVLPRYGAHVNDYTGDGVMAVFGGELGSLDRAHSQAIWAAVDLMNQMSATLRQELLGVQISDPVQVAMGLVSGPILWKCVGTEERNRVIPIGEVAPLAAKYVSGSETKAWQTMIGGGMIDAVPPRFREKAPDYEHVYQEERMTRERWLLQTEHFSREATSLDDVAALRSASALGSALKLNPPKSPVRRGSGNRRERTIG